MEYFKDLRESRIIRLVENKDRFIQKSTVLTDEQKKEVLDFFRSHANLENRIQNWNFNIPYETFKQVIDSVDTTDKRLKKQTKELRKQNGLEGLVEGEDYNLVYQDGSTIIYHPLTHKASRVIASNMVEPKIWCKSTVMKWSPKEVLPEGEPMKGRVYPGAKWCISMETDEHWNSYIEEGNKFFIVCNPNALAEKEKKVCLTYSSDNKFVNLTYADDSATREEPHDLTEIITEYLKKQLSENLKNISKYLNKETGRYDYLNRVFTPKDLIRDGKFIVPIGIWEGDFICSYSQLTSLQGAPEKVEGDFGCEHNKLTSLKGAPRIIKGVFSCFYNNLTSLEGAPKEVGGSFDCSYNQLTSLKGTPRKVKGRFICGFNQLASLEDSPKEVMIDFDCFNNQLTSLKGAPRKVGGKFDCSNNKLISLEGAPREVGRHFSCHDNQLTSLKEAPEKVGWSFFCQNNKLISLEGAPKEVGGSFDCSSNNLTSLQGAPREVGGWFSCDNNQLTSLKGAPREVGDNFKCSENPLVSLEGKPEHIGGRLLK